MTEEKFEKEYASHLNPQQKEAVHAVNGRTLLLAVPGSGKTTVLIARLGYMIYCKNIPAQKILTMSYTKAATSEMKERFLSKFKNEPRENPEFRTINGICSKIIAYYGAFHSDKQPFELITNEYHTSEILRGIYSKYSDTFPSSIILKDLKMLISYSKNMQLPSEELSEITETFPDFSSIFKDYNNELRSRKWMDYDDQMVYALGILNTKPAVLEHFQNLFPYICVDESQDTSKIQHEIIQTLVGEKGHLFMVGDEDQSIYGFRAAYPEALTGFKENFPTANILLMEENYRSTQCIVEVAAGFVAKNQGRYEKKIRSNQEAGNPVSTIKITSRLTQYHYMFSVLAQSREEIGVLFRNNSTAVPLIDLLERERIPYNYKQTDNIFFTSRIVLDLVDTLQFLIEPEDFLRFDKIYYKFSGYLKKETLSLAKQKSKETGCNVLESLSKLSDLSKQTTTFLTIFLKLQEEATTFPPSHLLNRIWVDLSYDNYAEKEHLDIDVFSHLCMLAEGVPTISHFLGKLQHLDHLIKNHENHPETKITLSTIHSSKGLEYDSVYLFDVFDDILPSVPDQGKKPSASDKKATATWTLYQEERRLYYVAITRAKKKLYFFQLDSRESSFHQEALSHNLQILQEETDLLSHFPKNMLGKTVHDKEYGTGTVIGECDCTYLLDFRQKGTRLFGVSQLFARYNPTLVPPQKESTDKKETKPVLTSGKKSKHQVKDFPPLKINDKVEHKTYGKGFVLTIDPIHVTIQFYSTENSVKFDLELAVNNGFLWW